LPGVLSGRTEVFVMTVSAMRASDIGWWLRQGAIGGFIAGIPFALFEMAAAAVMMGPEASTMPLRMIGAIPLGAAALEPTYPLATAALTGVVVHMVLSTINGAIFGAVVGSVPALQPSAPLVVGAVVYGLALWVVNFFVIAPIAGWTWFPEATDPLVQIVAHGVLFGGVLGGYLALVRRRMPEISSGG
jgi:hypothetical protein